MNKDDYISEVKVVHRPKGTHYGNSSIEPGLQSASLLDDETNQVSGSAIISDYEQPENNSDAEPELLSELVKLGAAILVGWGGKALYNNRERIKSGAVKAWNKITNRSESDSNTETVVFDDEVSEEVSEEVILAVQEYDDSAHDVTEPAQEKDDKVRHTLSPEQYEFAKNFNNALTDMLDHSIVDPAASNSNPTCLDLNRKLPPVIYLGCSATGEGYELPAPSALSFGKSKTNEPEDAELLPR